MASAGLLILFLSSLAPAQSWIQLAPTGALPPARAGHSAVFDANTDQMIVFGGSSVSGFFNDVWSLTRGTNPQWSLLQTSGAAPVPRSGHSAVYDSAGSRMIVYGGVTFSDPLYGEICTNQTWVLSNANNVSGTPLWTQLNPVGDFQVVRAGHTAVYDPISNRMIVFGGSDCAAPNPASSDYNDISILSNANGLGGTPSWSYITPAGTPPLGREGHTAIYDVASNRMTIFGGYNGSVNNRNSVGALNDVWVLLNANGLGGTPTWVQLNPAGEAPPLTYGAAAIYDQSSNRMTVWGGANSVGADNVVWVLLNANGAGGIPTWIQLTSAGTLPSPRLYATDIFDAGLKEMIVFGGLTTSSQVRNPDLNEAWVLTSPSGLLPLNYGSGKPRNVVLVSDFDGDGVDDITSWTPSTGMWSVLPSSNPAIPLTQRWGLPQDIPVPADYDGDGKADFAVWRPSNGMWYVIPSGGGAPYARQWGLPGDVPVIGDFDGDGKLDYAVWRPSNGTWYILPSSTGVAVTHQWGLPGDVPVTGDFDGDGTTDLAVWRPSNGTWYILPSSTGVAVTLQWGVQGDVPVIGDFDLDGRTDVAVWRPTNGMWYIVPSSTGVPAAYQWGLPGDVPISGNYTPNYSTGTLGVWRPSEGVWYLTQGNDPVLSFIEVEWGRAGDIPM